MTKGVDQLSGHSLWIGIEMAATGSDWSEVRLATTSTGTPLVGQEGVAAGPLITLIDGASGSAVYRKVGKAVGITTVDMRIEFLRQARPGASITVRGHCYKVDGHLAFVRCEAWDGARDDLVATAMTCWYLSGAA